MAVSLLGNVEVDRYLRKLSALTPFSQTVASSIMNTSDGEVAQSSYPILARLTD